MKGEMLSMKNGERYHSKIYYLQLDTSKEISCCILKMWGTNKGN